jgi:hypothetical protein
VRFGEERRRRGCEGLAELVEVDIVCESKDDDEESGGGGEL